MCVCEMMRCKGKRLDEDCATAQQSYVGPIRSGTNKQAYLSIFLVAWPLAGVREAGRMGRTQRIEGARALVDERVIAVEAV